MSRFRFRIRETASPPPTELASALLENLADAVLACDAEGKIVMHNRRAREILGASREIVEELGGS